MMRRDSTEYKRRKRKCSDSKQATKNTFRELLRRKRNRQPSKKIESSVDATTKRYDRKNALKGGQKQTLTIITRKNKNNQGTI